jgi:hypothetical protein
MADVKEIVREVFEAIQELRTKSTGGEPEVPGWEASAQLLRTVTQDGLPSTWRLEPEARKIFERWRDTDPRRRFSLIVEKRDLAAAPAGYVSVKVVDERSQPVPGIPVSFAVTEGERRTGHSRVVTDPNGVAAIPWTLGPNAGEKKLEASIGQSYVTITPTANNPRKGARDV